MKFITSSPESPGPRKVCPLKSAAALSEISQIDLAHLTPTTQADLDEQFADIYCDCDTGPKTEGPFFYRKTVCGKAVVANSVKISD